MKFNNGKKNFTYRLKDIKERTYNCNESGLFYHALPTLSLSNRGRALEIKTANLYGSLKKPLVIGELKRTQCFKNVKIDKLPMT